MKLSKKMHRICKFAASVILAVLLLLGGIANAATFGDVSESHWASKQIQEWLDKGLIKGYLDGSFKPDGTLTRAEFMTLVNGGFGFQKEQSIHFTDVKAGNWYESVVKRATAAAYISGYEDGTIRPDQKISRQEVAVIIARIAKLEGDEAAAATFSDPIPQWSKAAIGAVVKHGYMKGYPDGSFGAAKWVTRAEAVVALDNILKVNTKSWTIDKEGTYGPDKGLQTVKSDVTITAAGVTLQNVIIEGNLTIAESVGEGDVFLKGVTVKGETQINGGGEHSIHVEDSILVHVTVDKKSGKIRIIITGSTTIERMTINSNVLLDLEASIKIALAIFNAAGNVTGKGTIVKVIVNVPGVSFDNAPNSIETAPGVQLPTIRQGSTNSGDGGGGGGGSGGNNPGKSLVSIAITTPPTKLSYVVGQAIDLTGLVVTGTYNDASTAIESVSGANISGFNSSAPATGQVVTVTVGGKTATFHVDIVIPDGYIAITSTQDLNDIRNNLSGKYIQLADIDLSDYSGYDGWEPIGNIYNYFTGTYDGNGYAITNLTINSDYDLLGLFGVTGEDSIIKHVHLEEVLIVEEGSIVGSGKLGALVGWNMGSIESSYAKGIVKGGDYVGGLVGGNEGSIESSYAEVTILGANYVGGLAGYNDGPISDCSATVVVIGVNSTGGLVGYNVGPISDCSATVVVIGVNSTGGLVGDNEGSISDSYATGIVKGTSIVGGLVGSNGGSIGTSYAHSKVEGVDYVGGLVGKIITIPLRFQTAMPREKL